MKKINYLIVVVLLVSSTVFATVEKSGIISVNETWSGDTVKVTGDIMINNGITLTVDPGIYVEFQGHYYINVQGRILAEGNESNMIVFTAKDTVLTNNSGGWHGIRFNNTPQTNDTSKFEYTVLKYGNAFSSISDYKNGGAIYISNLEGNSPKQKFKDCHITKNRSIDCGAGIYCIRADITIEDCIIDHNRATIAYAGTKSGDGVGLERTKGRMINTVVSDNDQQGMYLFFSPSSEKFIIQNCSFINNGNVGVQFQYNYTKVENSLFWGNPNSYNSWSAGPSFSFCNLQGMIAAGSGNISEDPKLVGSGDHPYNLLGDSPCINGGNPDWTLDSIDFDYDILDSSRINHERIDIGAYEYQDTLDPRIIVTNVFINDSIRYDSLFLIDLYVLSYPDTATCTLLDNPDGMQLQNDSILWTPTEQQAGSTYHVSLKIENSQISDTINFTLYVLRINEFHKLEDQDIVWDQDTIKVFNNLEIKNGRTLFIRPGVYVEFQGHYSLNVKGRIMAEGTLDSMITFTARDTALTDTSGGWHGVRVRSFDTNDTSKFDCCILKYGNAYGSDFYDMVGGAIFVKNYNFSITKQKFTNCIITKNRAMQNGGGIYCKYGDIIFENCIISQNESTIGFWSNMSGDGLYLSYTSGRMINTVVSDNFDQGIYIDIDPASGRFLIKNSSITNHNYGGVFFRESSPKVENSIIWGNAESFHTWSANPEFSYCNIQNESIGGSGNIDVDPEFVGSGNNPYSLLAKSPCINAGNPAWTIDSLDSPIDVIGNERIKFGRIDIGAYEYINSKPVLFDKTISINENSSQNAIVDTIKAYYYESNSIVYSIISGNVNSAFDLDPSTGELIINSADVIDYEFMTDFALEISASDGVESDTCILDISLLDIDEFGINPFQSFSRSGAVSFVIDSTVYVGLGNNEDSVMCNFWKYDMATDLWTRVAKFPGNPRSEAVAFVINDNAYVGLGRSEFPYQYYKDFYKYDPETNQWSQIADFGGSARYNSVAFVIDSLGFVGTGKNVADEQKDFWKYDTQLDTWEQIADMSGDKRSGAVAFVINNKAYVSGGDYFDSYSVQLSDVQEYDPELNTWDEKIFADGINLSISDAASFVFGNKGYILYGNKSNVVSYDPETDDVTNYGDMLGLNDERFDPIGFILGSTSYFGLGFYGIIDSYYQKDIHEVFYLPSNITLTNETVDENSLVNTVVGTLSTEDGDQNSGFSFALVSGDGLNDANNSSFNISGNVLRSSESFDFETKQMYRILIQVEDSMKATYQKPFVIMINDINDPPTGISISSSTIDEKSIIGTVVGTFSAIDEDDIDSHTYTMATGDGINDADNSSFTIDGNELKNAEIFNFNTKELYNILVQVEDSIGETYQKSFAIAVNNVNDPPTDIVLSPSVIDENSDIGTLIGSFITFDEDEEDAHSYSFATVYGMIDNDSASFTISGAELYSAEVFDYETKNTYFIYVETSDNEGETYQKGFTVSIDNIVETGIQSFSSSGIKATPNPTNGIINLDVAEANIDEFELKVTNSQGKIIYKEFIYKKKTTIDLTGNPQGIYLLIIESTGQKMVQKIIIE